MATKLFLKQFANSGSGLNSYFYASLAASVLAPVSSVTNKINGTTQNTATAGGTVVQWISPPVAVAVTISGTITYNAWVKTSSTTGAPKTVGRVFKYTGTESQFSTKTSTLVQSTSIQHDSFTDTAPTSTTLAVGNRLVIKFFVASTSATGTETFDYGGKTSAADGDAWVQFTENISFQNEAEFIQSAANGASATTVTATFPGVSTAGNTVVVIAGWGPQSSTGSVSDGHSTYTPIIGPTNWNGSANREQVSIAVNIPGGTTLAVANTITGTPSFNALAIAEYANVSVSPLDQMSSATGSGTTADSGATPTTLFPNEICVGLTDPDAGWNANAGLNGYIDRGDALVILITDKSVTSTGTQDASTTIVNGAWFASVVTLKWGTQPSSANNQLMLTGVGT